jgi:hypothetical protein
MVMNKIELAPGIVSYRNVLTNAQEIVEELELIVSHKTLSWDQSYVRINNDVRVDKDYRDTQTISAPYFKDIKETPTLPHQFAKSTLSEYFYNAFNPCELDYFSQYNFNPESHELYSVLKYSEGQQFKNHIDDAGTLNRRVSTVFYMNDDYTGGEIEFPRFNLKVKPEKHQLLIFPSTYVYNHIVHPVLSGTRYSVVSWIK